jgi:hypothetical protein
VLLQAVVVIGRCPGSFLTAPAGRQDIQSPRARGMASISMNLLSSAFNPRVRGEDFQEKKRNATCDGHALPAAGIIQQAPLMAKPCGFPVRATWRPKCSYAKSIGEMSKAKLLFTFVLNATKSYVFIDVWQSSCQ